MGLFKSKEDDKTPVADPAAAPQDPNDDPKPQYVTMEAFKTFEQTVGVLAEGVKALNANASAYKQPNAPAAPPEDPYKADRQRISTIDTELDQLEEKIDNAVYEGKGAGALIKKQRQLLTERTDLQLKVNAPASDPRIDLGMNTIDALSTEIMSSKMKHLAIKEVKERYDHYINQLQPAQRMDPNAKKGCYDLAVGENETVIDEVKRQEWLREQTETATQDGGGGTGRSSAKTADGIPSPEDVLSPAALQSIKSTKHRTPENYYRSLGYDGWEDYFAKNKEYIVEEEEN